MTKQSHKTISIYHRKKQTNADLYAGILFLPQNVLKLHDAALALDFIY